MACDSEFQRDLNRINYEMAVEREIASASERMQMRELFDEASEHGEGYAQGYYDGFWQSRELYFKCWDPVKELSDAKYDDLNKRWGLDDLVDDKPLQLEQPKDYDIAGQAEELQPVDDLDNSDDELASLDCRTRAAWLMLFDAYIEACDKEDWYLALAIYQWLGELKIIGDEDEGEELIHNLQEWVAKVQNPWELKVCY